MPESPKPAKKTTAKKSKVETTTTPSQMGSDLLAVSKPKIKRPAKKKQPESTVQGQAVVCAADKMPAKKTYSKKKPLAEKGLETISLHVQKPCARAKKSESNPALGKKKAHASKTATSQYIS